MTYKIEWIIQLVLSPVKLVFPDGTRIEYDSGAAVSESVFENRYLIKNMKAVNNVLEVELFIPDPLDGSDTFC